MKKIINRILNTALAIAFVIAAYTVVVSIKGIDDNSSNDTEQPTNYIVVENDHDNLWTILGKKMDHIDPIFVQAIAEANGLTGEYVLYQGDVIVIPDEWQ